MTVVERHEDSFFNRDDAFRGSLLKIKLQKVNSLLDAILAIVSILVDDGFFALFPTPAFTECVQDSVVVDGFLILQLPVILGLSRVNCRS